MGEKLKEFLRGMASTMELVPPAIDPPPPHDPGTRSERMNLTWQRTGRVLQNAMDSYSREQIAK
jgi:hypothetical protein